jgi:starvation-inducible DNA-binding protein
VLIILKSIKIIRPCFNFTAPDYLIFIKQFLIMNEVNNSLNQLLASYQIYYQNLRGFHWNIVGRDFFALHAKFEDYYNEAADVIDEVAERIKILDGTPFHTFADYISHSKVPVSSNIINGTEAVKLTLSAVETILLQLLEVLEVASEASDEGTIGMISELISSSEKKIWMLKAYLK